MLRRLDVGTQYRSLAPGFWPDIPAGKRTVIYGHNGSGKSTLSELLLAVAAGASPVAIVWEDEAGDTHRVAPGGHCPTPSISVFTKRWVEDNLSEFLVGRNASAIVTLGREAIDAKEDEARLEEEIEELAKAERDAESKRAELSRKVERIAREVQDQVVAQLRPFDYSKYSKNRFSMPVVSGMLRDFQGDFPDPNQYAEALKRLGEGALDVVDVVASPPGGLDDTLSALAAVLRETPTRVALASLESNAAAQAWVEQGMSLHEDSSHCMFCSGPVTEERLQELGAHFDQSWRDIRARANDLAREVRDAHEALERWLAGLPDAHALASDLRGGFRDQVQTINVEVDLRLALLKEIEKVATAKGNDPSATPKLPDWSLLTTPLKVAAMVGAVVEHNQQAAAHNEIAESNATVVIDHLTGSKAQPFRDLEKQLTDATKKRDDAASAANLAQIALSDVRQKTFSSHEMAETLTKDLRRVYGKNHLSVTVTSDGKSYACRRGNGPAEHLSDGERTTLSLLYFLRKLQDESDTSDPAQRIVVIDDPTSSLDREAIFATHQWLISTLEDFGQFIVLTHDFSLLRLFIKSQKGQWDKATTKIKQGNLDEKRFPRASFLEMFASAENEARTTKVEALPPMLRNNVSEYAYLFSMVMRGVADPSDVERLFLLPNAARRVLEVFCSYKAPHRSTFDQQLETLIEASDDAYRDVYDFCNRYSHGEGNESVDVLDARTVQQQIRRCMAFLKGADGDHFDRMCKATQSDATLV